MFLCHIENGKDIVSVDELAHIFIWKYDPEYLSGTTNMYRPAHKYRISLTYNLFQIVNQYDAKPEDNQDFERFFLNSFDYRHFVRTNGHHKFVTLHKRPPENGLMFFTETTFNSRKTYVGSKTSAYAYTEQHGELRRIRHTKDRQVVGLEVIKSHLFGDLDFKTVEIVLFKATPSKQAGDQRHELHQTKIAINVEQDVPFDFDFSDELDAFGFPYVYFLHYNFLTIVSPITNQRVKSVDFGPSLMQKIEEHKLV